MGKEDAQGPLAPPVDLVTRDDIKRFFENEHVKTFLVGGMTAVGKKILDEKK